MAVRDGRFNMTTTSQVIRCEGSAHSGVRTALLRAAAIALLCATGCGTTLSRTATEQILTSAAVDQAIAQVDFRVLSGKKVFLEPKYIEQVKWPGFINSAYIISALRQQMLAARCLLQDKMEDADYIVEPRVGALGTDGTEIIYGIPQNNALSAVSSVIPTAPAVPAIPEMAFAKKNSQMAAAKLGVFAYHRVTKEPVWQSGLAEAKSTARDMWVFGAGPFQQGTIYEGTAFAGGQLLPLGEEEHGGPRGPLVSYSSQVYFGDPAKKKIEPVIAPLPPGAKPGVVAAAPAEAAAAAAEPPKAEPAAPAPTAETPKPAAAPAAAPPEAAAAAPAPPGKALDTVTHGMAKQDEFISGWRSTKRTVAPASPAAAPQQNPASSDGWTEASPKRLSLVPHELKLLWGGGQVGEEDELTP